jgi:hypothetical protein
VVTRTERLEVRDRDDTPSAAPEPRRQETWQERERLVPRFVRRLFGLSFAGLGTIGLVVVLDGLLSKDFIQMVLAAGFSLTCWLVAVECKE